MEKETPKANTSQGDKVAVERNPSSTYTIKSLAGNIKKLEKLKMCNKEELDQIKKIHRTILEHWIGGNLEL